MLPASFHYAEQLVAYGNKMCVESLTGSTHVCDGGMRGYLRSMVWVRSGPTDTMVMGVPSSFSRKAM